MALDDRGLGPTVCTFEWKSDRQIFGNAPLLFSFLLCRAFTLTIFAFHWRWVHFVVTESRGIAENWSFIDYSSF
jgi:hypothetical protein